MSTQAQSPLAYLSRPLRVMSVQARPGRVESWPPMHDLRCIVLPPVDEKAWEGTEIDVRRTVL